MGVVMFLQYLLLTDVAVSSPIPRIIGLVSCRILSSLLYSHMNLINLLLSRYCIPIAVFGVKPYTDSMSPEE